MARQDWQTTDGGALTRVVPILGRVDIKREHEGYCISINSRTAWSGYRGHLQDARFAADRYIETWQYLNSFVLAVPAKGESNG